MDNALLQKSLAHAFGDYPELLEAATKAAAADESAAINMEFNLTMLLGAAPSRLWPSTERMDEMVDEALLAAAAQTAKRLADQESMSGPVIRDSESMVLELIHASGDPRVLAGPACEGWLWGPLGPPVQVSEPPELQTRYAVHAAAVNMAWDRRVVRKWAKHEAATYKNRWTADSPEINGAGEALDRGYIAYAESQEALEEGTKIAAEAPAEEWPAEKMAAWSAVGWEQANIIRDSAIHMLAAAETMTCVSAISEHAENEARGWALVGGRARLAALRRWWDDSCPKADTSAGPLSYWTCEVSPARFWGGAMTAGMIEFGQAMHGGGVEGLAAALTNR